MPEDLLLPRAAPASRRRFLDLAIFNVERGYYDEASAYQKVLKNRNALLKRGPADPMLLDTYDEELARTGARVVMRRRALVAALTPLFRDHFRALHSELPVSLAYAQRSRRRAGERRGGRCARACTRAWRARRGLDERRRFTGFGPHTDDLEIGLAGRAGAQPRLAGAAALAGARAQAGRAVERARRASAIRRCCCSTTCRASSIRCGARFCST